MALIKLRDIDYVGPLEWALEQRGPERSNIAAHGYGHSDDLEERGHGLAEHLFGICDEDIELDDSHFPVLRMFRDEADAYWASHGWDVTDGQGKQLRCMEYLIRPMVCAVERLHPDATLPSATDAWAAQLEEEAKRFKPSR